MMRFKILWVGVILLSTAARAQVSGGFETNTSLYIDDSKIKLEEIEARNRLRANSYLRIDYTRGKFTMGIQAESYYPKALLNYSPNFKNAGLGTYYVQYKNDSIGLDITAGHFYEEFGSGLALRSWEDRQLGVANSIAGGRIKYTLLKAIQLTALYGKQRNGLGFNFTDGSIFGANAGISLSPLLKWEKIDVGFGYSFVNRLEAQSQFPGLDKSAFISSVRGNIKKGGFTADAEYAFKSKDALVEFGNVRPEFQFDGDAFLFNVGYSQQRFGVNASFRRLENFGFFSQRNLSGNVYNEGFLNYVPALTKQYDYSLTNIYVYAAQANISFEPNRNKAGEIGGQIDLFYNFKKGSMLGGEYGTGLSVNFARWHGLSGRYEPAQRKYKADLAGFGQKYYQETSMEIRKKWSTKYTSVFTFLNQYYNRRFVEETVGEVNANTIVVENTLRLGKAKSARWELQHQWADGGFNNWAAVLAEYNAGIHWSFFVTDLYNYGNEAAAKQLHYYNFGFAYKKNGGRLQASYGRQRGGLICVGGVCRFVPESAGLNMGLNFNF
jgi:hypothetical protein